MNRGIFNREVYASALPVHSFDMFLKKYGKN